MDAPNAVWTADFKGEFKTRDGLHSYPLTVCDDYSRYLLACRALPSTGTDGARAVFERPFREYGLPERIRSDNGVPFATGRRRPSRTAATARGTRADAPHAQGGATRSYPRRSPLEYPAHWELRRVSRNRGTRRYDRWVNVSHVAGRHRLAEEYVAFEEVAAGLWQVYFGPLRIGRFEERPLKIVDQHDGTTRRNPRRVLPMSLD